MKETKAESLLSKMKKGQVYRRSDLTRHSTAVDRYLDKLVGANQLVRLSAGMYFRPDESLFGALPPDDHELVLAFLKDNRFLLNSFSNYTQLGLGMTQLYNNQVVYNYKRHGEFTLGGKKFYFKRLPKFPRHLSKEFLLVDMFNNLKKLSEDYNLVTANFLKNKDKFDAKKVLSLAKEYGRPRTKKLLEDAYQK